MRQRSNRGACRFCGWRRGVCHALQTLWPARRAEGCEPPEPSAERPPTLEDVVDLPTLRALMKDFYRVTGTGVGIVDLQGDVLVAEGWQEICTEFHRRHPETRKNCIESDVYLSDGVEPGTFREYKCRNHMWDIATPIVIGGWHVGNIFLGQFFYSDEEPDYETFREMARTYGFDEKAYLEALDRVPRWDRSHVHRVMHFYARLANLIAGEGYSRLELSRALQAKERFEEQLKEAVAEADRANRAKSDFLAGMSHEIRTPMNGVVGMASLLLDTELTDEQRRYAQVIQSSGESLLGIIGDILDLSRIEAGKLELEEAAFNLSGLLDELTGMMELRAAQKGLALHCSVAPGVPVLLRGDAGRIRQILINLVNNAIKFTDRGEVAVLVTLEAKEQTAAHLRFTVWDTGMGIPTERQGELFRSFSQLRDRAGRREGTGLGLAISRQLVEKMGGEIGVESEEGTGSTFWFTLRLERQQGSGSGEAARGSVHSPMDEASLDRLRRSGARILVAEDDPAGQKVARALLGRLGLHCDVVADGAGIPDVLAGDGYDLVLMDVSLPGEDGCEVTERIRDPESGVPDRGIPVIAMTAHAMEGDRERCLQAGMNDYLAKPVTLQALTEMLVTWLLLGGCRKGPPEENPEETPHGPPVFDLDAVLERFGGDGELALEVARITLEELPGGIDAVETALASGDGGAGRHAVHKLKGAAANVGGEALRGEAEEVECFFGNGDLRSARRRLPVLRRQCRRLAAALEGFLEEQA
ncbi:MAG: PocR ligand-binding domain-containing protein [Synergistales bacterium]|nr:PocR ligand-binding domain-containing protein [Synergistales bacterium]